MKIFEIFIGLTTVFALCLSAPISDESIDESSSSESHEHEIASIANDFLTIHLGQTGNDDEDNQRIVGQMNVEDQFVEYDEVVRVIISAFPVEFEVLSEISDVNKQPDCANNESFINAEPRVSVVSNGETGFIAFYSDSEDNAEESSPANDTAAIIERPSRTQKPVSSSAEMEILWFIESLKQDKLTVENRKPYNEEIKESPEKSYAEVLGKETCPMEKSSEDTSEKKIDEDEENDKAEDIELKEEVSKDEAIDNEAEQSNVKPVDQIEGEASVDSQVQEALQETFAENVKEEDESVEALGIFEEEVVEMNEAKPIEEVYDGSPEISLKIKEVLLDKEIRRGFEGDLNEIDADFEFQSFSSEESNNEPLDSSPPQSPVPMSGGLLTKMKNIFNFFFD